LQLTPDTQMAFDILISYHSVLESPIKKLEAIKKGLLSSAIKDLGDLFGSNQAYMADLLSITQPTLRKYIKERKQLDTNKSEHIIELFELFEKGVDTFGSLEEFKKWIDSPNVIFNERPVKLLDTITGINMVKNALLRLDYGVLA
ncbi:MAG: antitoxin Xre/MbcA/ParS toxin-binding domain-containing protein, partial [Daejeonella sp.]|uniref:type II RES/Xre toxin-antitoxin system antitoxin n=1 Tax=Daejeonella sp. TaxID=2805397 RepID=UPI003C76B2A6